MSGPKVGPFSKFILKFCSLNIRVSMFMCDFLLLIIRCKYIVRLFALTRPYFYFSAFYYLFNRLRLGSVSCIFTVRGVCITLKFRSDHSFSDQLCLTKEYF